MSFTFADTAALTRRLWVGGALSTAPGLGSRQLTELVEYGLTHLIDTRAECTDIDRVRLHAPAVRYHWQGIPDEGQRLPAVWFDQVVGVALEALDQPDTIVLTHCQAGVNRGPSLALAVLIAQGWDPIEAIEEIHQARPHALIRYAEDAISWAHGRGGMAHELGEDLTRLSRWRHERDVLLTRGPRHRRPRRLLA